MGPPPHPVSTSTTQIFPPPPTSSSSSSPTSASASGSADNAAPSDSHYLNPTHSPSSSSNDHDHDHDSIHRRTRMLDLIRLALTVLIIGAGAAVVGCEAHALHVYDQMRLEGEGWGIPALWPESLDVRATVGMVVGGAVVVAAGLGYVGLGLVPVPQRFYLLTILLSTSLSVVGLAGALFGVVYTTHIANGDGYDRDNIQSWTCRWVDGAALAERLFTNGLSGIAYPTGFKRVCRETHVGFDLLAILICLETVVVVVTGLCAWLEVKMRRAERDGAVGAGFGEKELNGRRFY